MSTTDPIADMLTSLRNANQAGKPEILVPHSRVKADMVRVLKREGFINDFKVQRDGKKTRIQVFLKGTGEGRAVTGLRRISKPGGRRYVSTKEIPRVLAGMGICILSTSGGVMTGQEARKRNLGGEVLCTAW